MKCPSCRTEVAEDAVVCPSCEFVLDPSLQDLSPPEGDDVTGPVARRGPPPPRSRGTRKRPAPGKPAAASTSSGRPRSMPEAPARPAAPAAKGDWRSQVSQEDWGPDRGPAQAFTPDRAATPDDLIGEARALYRQASAADQLVFFGAVAMFLATFFPWRESRADGGEILGILTWGAFVMALSLLLVTAMYLRLKRDVVQLNPLFMWIAQLAAASLAVLWCLFFIRLAWDSTLVRPLVGTAMMWKSKPLFGAFLALMAACVSLAGTVLGLRGGLR